MLNSIRESYISQAREQGRQILSSENRYLLSSFAWKPTVEGELFWRILYYSYLRYNVYDYETLIKLYIRFNTIPNYIINIYYIYRYYFDKKKNTLTSEGFEKLIKKKLGSIQESFIEQSREQGETIRSSENRYYLFYLNWEGTVEGDLFWRILHFSYSMYRVYEYGTIIKIFSRFNTVPNKSTDVYDIYRDYFDKKKGTLTSEGFEKLIKKIEKC